MRKQKHPMQFHIIMSILLLWSAAATGEVLAQPQRMSPKDRAARLKEQLSLSDSQTVSVTKIYEESQQEMSKAFSDSSSDRQGRREIMMKVMSSTDARIDSLLTDEQKAKFAEIKKQRQNRTGRRPRQD